MLVEELNFVKITMKELLLATFLVCIAGCTESTAEKGSDKKPLEDPVNVKASGLNEQKIISNMSKYDIGFEEHSRYFSLYAFGKTRNFIYFKNENAVYEVKFESPDAAVITLNEFSASDKDNIPLWINNQHSDGLYGEAPTPEAVTIDSSSLRILENEKVGGQEGDNGDEYDVFGVKYYLASQKTSAGVVLPELIYNTKVYVRTKDITCAPVCEQ